MRMANIVLGDRAQVLQVFQGHRARFSELYALTNMILEPMTLELMICELFILELMI